VIPVPLLVGFCFKVAKEGIVLAQRRRRFEIRISDEDRQRLRTLAQQQATTESGAFRALLRQAEIATDQDSKSGKEEAVAA
jgi:hypothetical protein